MVVPRDGALCDGADGPQPYFRSGSPLLVGRTVRALCRTVYVHDKLIVLIANSIKPYPTDYLYGYPKHYFTI